MFRRQYRGEDRPLRKILPSLFPEVPYSELCALIRRKDVKINDKRVGDGSLIVTEGDEISVYPKKKKDIAVVYEDENIMVCNKPKGIASNGVGGYESLVRAQVGENVVLMHRLDTNTDGLLLFAKNPLAEKELFQAIKNGFVEKVYHAEVYGHPKVFEDCHLLYYYKKNEEEQRALISRTPREGYVPVELTFHVLQEKEQSSLLQVTLHKGKMHQIRAMLASYGFFILGDGKYGDDHVNKMLGIKRHLLTATEIKFHFSPKAKLFYLNTVPIAIL